MLGVGHHILKWNFTLAKICFFDRGFSPFQRDLPFCVNHLVHLNFVIKIFTFGKAPWIRALPNVALGSIATLQPHLPVM